MIIDLNIVAKTIILLEENIGVNFPHLRLRNGFLDKTPKVQVTKEKKWINWTSSKKFLCCKCYQQGSGKYFTFTKWKKVFANHIADKRLASRIYKQLLNFNNKKINGSIKKDLSRHFSKADTQMAKKHIQRCLVSVIIRKMQIKTTMRYHFILTTVAII